MKGKPADKAPLFAKEQPPTDSHDTQRGAVGATLPNKLDKKFYGLVYKTKDDSVVQQDQWVVFLAKDDAFATVLPMYRRACELLGADDQQLAAVDRLIADVDAWRAANPTRCKTPDIKPDEKLLP